MFGLGMDEAGAEWGDMYAWCPSAGLEFKE